MIARLGKSIRARLALWASVAMTLLCLLAGSAMLWVGHDAATDLRTRELIFISRRPIHWIKQYELTPVIDLPLKGAQVIGPAGQVAASTPNLAGSPRLSRTMPDPVRSERVEEACGLPQFRGQCQIMVVSRVDRGDGQWLVYAFNPTVPWYVSPAALGSTVGMSVLLVMITWFGVSKVVARTLAPVNEITERMIEITQRQEAMRVPVPENADEVKALAEAANRMLSQMEAAIEQQRRFASDASHDLRSPITAMRAELEAAMLAPQETDWCDTGDRLMASLNRLQNIVTDLLALAKLDAGAPGAFEPVDLAELVAGETTRPRSRKVITSLQPGVVVMGDRLRLARLLTNLLDNAERHADSTILVTVRRNGEAVLEVLDDGAGIAPEQREVVFRRFTRLDASRSRDAGGTGLGLSIAREIARLHQGTLKIEDSDVGARFVLRIPIRRD
ncbi:HAMP domain-containing sensor histidine kinase [Nonomuraea sp. NPDC050786]|uniref:sensor histidine kinase n=1 Tax=Nonomuraea sp. NPDC050786 TaxID=3154840 RepID=UPI0033D94917